MRRRADSLILAAALGAVSSCSEGAVKNPNPPAAEAKQDAHRFSAFPCAGDASAADLATRERRARAEALHLQAAADFVSVRMAMEGAQDILAFAGNRQVLAERGAACAAAPSQDPCLKELQQLEVDVQKARSGPTSVYALTTAGGTAKAWSGASGLKALFEPIDTQVEAWFVMMASTATGQPVCGDAQRAAYRQTTDGYELRLQAYTSRCKPVKLEQLVYGVSRAGDVKKVESHTLSSDPTGCFAD